MYGDDLAQRPAARCGAAVYRSTNQSIPGTGVGEPIAFDAIDYNPVGMWTIVAPAITATKIYAPVAGYYFVAGTVMWDTSGAGTEYAHAVVVNASTAVAFANHIRSLITTAAVPATTTCFLNAGDFVEMYAYQDSGGPIDIVAALPYSIRLAVHRLP